MSDMVKMPDAGAIEKVLIGGDLSVLNEQQRTVYYLKVCESVGLNALTKPFEYLLLKAEGGKEKLVLYATRTCTDQLRELHKVSVEIVDRTLANGLYVVTARAKLPDGRCDESTGAVSMEREGGDWKSNQNGKRYFQGNGEWTPLKGDFAANAMMKAETKAKRRVTLSICGLGILDESEVDSIPGAKIGTEAEQTPAIPSEPNGNGGHKPKYQSPEEWSKALVTRIRDKEGSLIAAGKCFPGQLLETLEQAWADAGLPDQPSKWTPQQQSVGSGLAKSIIAEFEAKPAPAENLDADPVDGELEAALS